MYEELSLPIFAHALPVLQGLSLGYLQFRLFFGGSNLRVSQEISLQGDDANLVLLGDCFSNFGPESSTLPLCLLFYGHCEPLQSVGYNFGSNLRWFVVSRGGE